MILLANQRYLSSKPDIVALLSPYAGGPPIFRYRRPQDSNLPAIVLSLVSGSPDYHLLGEMGDTDSIIQHSVYADDYLTAHKIGELVRLAMSGFAGQWPLDNGNENPPIEVKAITIRSEIDDEIPRGDSSDAVIYRCTRDYQIHYERAVSSVFT